MFLASPEKCTSLKADVCVIIAQNRLSLVNEIRLKDKPGDLGLIRKTHMVGEK